MTLSPPPESPLPIVLHADDQPLILGAVARLLYGYVTMLPPITSLHELDERIRTGCDFDLLLLDLVFGPDSALARIRQYMSWQPGLKILVLTGHCSLRIAQQCMAAGAVGVLAKPFAISEIRDAIAEVHAGGLYVSPEIGSPQDVLSPELALVGEVTLEVLSLARSGLSDKEIADLLGISPAGVQHHKAILKRRLGLPPGHTDWTLV